MRKALELGCDVVGGIPHYEWTRDMGVEDVHYAFALAKEFNRDIDCHCDETDDPHSRFTEVMAADTIEHGWQGRVTTSHCTAMGSYDDAYAFKLIGLLARAGVNVVRILLIMLCYRDALIPIPNGVALRVSKNCLQEVSMLRLAMTLLWTPGFPSVVVICWRRHSLRFSFVI